MRRKLCAIAVMLILAILLCPCALAAEDIDVDAEGSVVLHMSYDGKAVTGGELRLIRIGSVMPDGSAYVLLPELGGGPLTPQDLDRAGTADALAAEEALRALPYQTAGFDQEGKARFDQDVGTGLYLILQTEACPGFQKISPILISVPMHFAGRDGYDYDIDVSVKPEPTPDQPTPTPDQPTPTPDQPTPTPDQPTPTPDQPTPTPDQPTPTPDQPGPDEPTPSTPVVPPYTNLPQTGQLNWPVPVMTCLGLLLLLAGIVLLRGDRKSRK